METNTNVIRHLLDWGFEPMFSRTGEPGSILTDLIRLLVLSTYAYTNKMKKKPRENSLIGLAFEDN